MLTVVRARRYDGSSVAVHFDVVVLEVAEGHVDGPGKARLPVESILTAVAGKQFHLALAGLLEAVLDKAPDHDDSVKYLRLQIGCVVHVGDGLVAPCTVAQHVQRLGRVLTPGQAVPVLPRPISHHLQVGRRVRPAHVPESLPGPDSCISHVFFKMRLKRPEGITPHWSSSQPNLGGQIRMTDTPHTLILSIWRGQMFLV